jgi:hypothetical protein
MAQVSELKHKAMSSNPSTARKENDDFSHKGISFSNPSLFSHWIY